MSILRLTVPLTMKLAHNPSNFVFLQENCVYETVVLPLDEETFEKTVTPIVQEYFEHGDANEVAVRFITVLLNEEMAFALSYLISAMQSCALMSKQT